MNLIEIPRHIWSWLPAEDDFYHSLDLMIYELEEGASTKRQISTTLRKRGLKIDWLDYAVTFAFKDNTGVDIQCPACNLNTRVHHFLWQTLECDECHVISLKDYWALSPNYNLPD